MDKSLGLGKKILDKWSPATYSEGMDKMIRPEGIPDEYANLFQAEEDRPDTSFKGMIQGLADQVKELEERSNNRREPPGADITK